MYQCFSGLKKSEFTQEMADKGHSIPENTTSFKKEVCPEFETGYYSYSYTLLHLDFFKHAQAKESHDRWFRSSENVTQKLATEYEIMPGWVQEKGYAKRYLRGGVIGTKVSERLWQRLHDELEHPTQLKDEDEAGLDFKTYMMFGCAAQNGAVLALYPANESDFLVRATQSIDLFKCSPAGYC